MTAPSLAAKNALAKHYFGVAEMPTETRILFVHGLQAHSVDHLWAVPVHGTGLTFWTAPALICQISRQPVQRSAAKQQCALKTTKITAHI
mmetsp:Transcript_32262/g.52202  ORF Transcript_32262/g.52202 Transcript_32262/m.52202 type:complete len:90 (-) Transcript_32262:334-603(-)